MNNTIACLRTCELLKDLPDAEIQRLVEQASFRKDRKHTIIISAGDMTDSVYIIESGRVRVYRDNSDGKQITLNTLGPGMMFGELASIAEAPRVASVETLESTRTLVIGKQVFMDLLERNPCLAISISKRFAQIVHIMSDHLAEIALLDIYGRLTCFLERSAIERDGKRVIKGFTHQELAYNVGSSREMVSRILSGLKKGKYISYTSESRDIFLERKLPAGW